MEFKFSWFTGEKVFTVTTPKNLQDDRVYALAASRKRRVATQHLLRTRSTVSVGFPGRVQDGANGPDIRRSWSEDQ